MTVDEIKNEILSKSIELGLCDAYQDLKIATTKSAIAARAVVGTNGNNIVEWSRLENIVDDTLLAEFDDSDLNPNGIFKNPATITNPSTDIFILSTSSGTTIININGNNKCKIRILGNSTVIVNVSGNGYVDIKNYGEVNLSVILNDDSSCLLLTTRQSQNNVTASNNSVIHMTTTDDSVLNFNGHDLSKAVLQGYNNSQVGYRLYDSSTFIERSFNASSVTDNTAGL